MVTACRMWELEGEPAKPILRGHNVASEFDRAIMHLDKGVKKQVKYYKVSRIAYIITLTIHMALSTAADAFSAVKL